MKLLDDARVSFSIGLVALSVACVQAPSDSDVEESTDNLGVVATQPPAAHLSVTTCGSITDDEALALIDRMHPEVHPESSQETDDDDDVSVSEPGDSGTACNKIGNYVPAGFFFEYNKPTNQCRAKYSAICYREYANPKDCSGDCADKNIVRQNFGTLVHDTGYNVDASIGGNCTCDGMNIWINVPGAHGQSIFGTRVLIEQGADRYKGIVNFSDDCDGYAKKLDDASTTCK